jgi:hypothetical protein
MIARHTIRSLVESQGADVASKKLVESLKSGDLKPSEISLRTLAEGMLGEEVVSSWAHRSGGLQMLMEAGEGVTIRAFSNTLGGIITAEIEAGYKRPATIGEQLVTVKETPNRFDRIGMPSEFLADDVDVAEGAEIPTASFGERYIDTPETTKKALIVGVTQEMVVADQTGQMLEHAGTIGELIAQRKEVKILRGVLGLDNTYKENGTSLNTYLTSGAWINSAALELIDHSSVETALTALSAIDAPSGGLPLLGMPDTILVPFAKSLTAQRVASSPNIEVRTASGANIVTQANPYANQFQSRVFSSPWIRKLLVASGLTAAQADKNWIIGDTRKAFQYRQNWPLTVTPIGPRPDKQIVAQFVASERGALAVREPRYVYKGTH